MNPNFVQIHLLMNYPASLLNRDDSGLAKRITMGDSTRLRISSQSLKHHWSTHDGMWSLSRMGLPETIRSRITFQREIVEPLVQEGYAEQDVLMVVSALSDVVFGKSEKAKKADKKADEKKAEKKADKKADKKDEEPESSEEAESVATKQVTVLGRPEVMYIKSVAEDILKGIPTAGSVAKSISMNLEKKSATFKANLRAIPMGAGISAAAFGRMATSDALARYDSSVNVAHAVTVHPAMAENDYFSAIDGLASSDDRAVSGHLNSTELSTGLYYVYVCVDVRQLASNVSGVDIKEWNKLPKDTRMLVGEIVQRFMFLASTVSTAAKKGSTAPFTYATTVMVQMGEAEPYQLSDSFLEGIVVRQGEDLVQKSHQAMATTIRSLDNMFGLESRRAISTRKDDPCLSFLPHGNLPEIGRWIVDSISSGKVEEFKRGE